MTRLSAANGVLRLRPLPAALAAAGIALLPATAVAFPPVIELTDLLPAHGGDGSIGFVLSGINRSDQTGRSVARGGDVNGDGIDDFVIGAPYADPAGNTSGSTYVVFGRAERFPAETALSSLLPGGGGDGSAGFVLHGIDEFDYSGRSVSAAGDVNGDGIDDVVVGAYKADTVFYAGQSYVVFGRTSGFPAAIDLWTLLPEHGGDGDAGFVIDAAADYDYSGDSVSDAGDVNGDGIPDLIVGARYASPGGRHHAGGAHVVFGRTDGFPPRFALADLLAAHGGDGRAGFALHGAAAGDLASFSYSGRGVRAAGDVNGDGVDDVIVGASGADPHGAGFAGATYLVFGRTNGFAPEIELAELHPANGGDGSAGFVLAGIDADDISGEAVGGAGDVNGDGIDDLIVGASGADPAGESYVVFGRADGFPPQVDLASLLAANGGDGNGIVSFGDLGVMKRGFFRPPGPSGTPDICE